MNLVTETDDNLQFQFLAEKESGVSHLPQYVWKSLVLNGFNSKSSEVVELKATFSKSFHHVYPELSLIELARVYQVMLNSSDFTDTDHDEFLNIYKIRPSSQTKRILLEVPKLPGNFGSWCNEKNLCPSDLISLLSLSDWSQVSETLVCLTRFKPSKSNGIQAIELIVELLLMNHDPSPKADESFPSWLKRLKQMRYPLRTSQTKSSVDMINELAWPPRTKAQWRASGDQDSLQVQLEARSLQEFEKKLHQLNKVVERMKEKNPWITN